MWLRRTPQDVKDLVIGSGMSEQGKIVIASLSKAYFGKVTSVDDLVAEVAQEFQRAAS